MESRETPTPDPSRTGASPASDALSGEEIRRATFPQALRGYDRQAVHDLLDRVADWMEGTAASVSSAAPDMRDELMRVGEKTAGILTAAEDAARNLREEAAEYAERLRGDAEDEARKARLNASQRMDEMIADAEEKARRIVDDAVGRRRQLNLAISSLIDRRDEIAADTTRLAEELLRAVEQVRRSDTAAEKDPSAAGTAAPPHFSPADEEPVTGQEELDEESLTGEEPVTGEEPLTDEEALDEEPLTGEEELDEEPLTGEEDLGVAAGDEAVVEEETQLHPGPDSEDTQIFETGPDAPRTRRLLVDPDEEA